MCSEQQKCFPVSFSTRSLEELKFKKQNFADFLANIYFLKSLILQPGLNESLLRTYLRKNSKNLATMSNTKKIIFLVFFFLPVVGLLSMGLPSLVYWTSSVYIVLQKYSPFGSSSTVERTVFHIIKTSQLPGDSTCLSRVVHDQAYLLSDCQCSKGLKHKFISELFC